MELHGVKLTFRFQEARTGSAQTMAKPRAEQERQAAGGSAAIAQRPPTTRARSPDIQRPRRGEGRHGTTRTERAQSTAGENAGEASRASAGRTAEASPETAQSTTRCSPRRPNSRQRRSANRMVEFIRAKQAQQAAAAAAAPPQSTVAERSSPKRAHENGAREGGGSSSGSRRRIVDVDYEARQEAAAALYMAWRQHTLTTTTNTSPKRALDHGAQEGDVKRGGGQRRLVNPGLPRW